MKKDCKGDALKKMMSDSDKRKNARTVLQKAMEKSDTGKKSKKTPVIPGKYH